MLRTLGFTLSLLVLSASLSAFAQEPLEHTKESLDTVKKNLHTGKAILLDVREPKEWDAGHLKIARPFPLSQAKSKQSLDELLKTLPKDKVIYTHCRAGTRALICGTILKKQGFDVRPLNAGYQDLIAAGFEKAAKK